MASNGRQWYPKNRKVFLVKRGSKDGLVSEVQSSNVGSINRAAYNSSGVSANTTTILHYLLITVDTGFFIPFYG